MPRPKAGPRVTGPYFVKRRNQWMIRIYGVDGPPEEVLLPTEDAARQAAKNAAMALPTQSRQLRNVIDEYFADKQRRGQIKFETSFDQRRCLERFFDEELDTDLAKITSRRAETIYLRATERPSVKTGKPISAATHRMYLSLAVGFFHWAVRKSYIHENPFKQVEPVGRVSVGKPQLRLDEAIMYRDAGLRLFDETRDTLALAAVIPLYLGMRASEVLRRKVRDVDAAGAILWIDKGKTKNARRHLSVKAAPLRTRLLQLAANRSPDEPLFGMNSQGKPHKRQAMNIAVTRVCRAAGVPVVCPHSLRGLWATLSIESGAAESAVAAALGHGSFEMTAKHYAQPEALSGARSARMMNLLDGPNAAADSLSQEAAASRAAELFASLPPEVLSSLAALLTSPAGPFGSMKKEAAKA